MRAYVRDQRRAGWLWIHHAVLDDFALTGVITSTELLVYVSLCRFVNSDGEAWPSAGSIGARVGLSDRAARRALQRLQDVGLIAIERRRDERGDQPSVYVLLDPHDRGTDSRSDGSASESGRPLTDSPAGTDSRSDELDPQEQEPENNKNGRRRAKSTPEFKMGMTLQERAAWIERRKRWRGEG